jgi:hypothetical protein
VIARSTLSVVDENRRTLWHFRVGVGTRQRGEFVSSVDRDIRAHRFIEREALLAYTTKVAVVHTDCKIKPSVPVPVNVDDEER